MVEQTGRLRLPGSGTAGTEISLSFLLIRKFFVLYRAVACILSSGIFTVKNTVSMPPLCATPCLPSTRASNRNPRPTGHKLPENRGVHLLERPEKADRSPPLPQPPRPYRPYGTRGNRRRSRQHPDRGAGRYQRLIKAEEAEENVVGWTGLKVT